MAGVFVDRLSVREDLAVTTLMPVGRRDVANRTVAMLMVVPAHELRGPGLRGLEIGKAVVGIRRAVLAGAEQRLRVRVIVAHPRAAVGELDLQPLERRLEGTPLHRAAVIGMQHRRARDAVLGEHRAAHKLAKSNPILGLEDLGGDNLAAVDNDEQIEIEGHPSYLRQQPRDVAGPDLVRAMGYVCRRWAGIAWRLGASAVMFFAPRPERAIALRSVSIAISVVDQCVA